MMDSQALLRRSEKQTQDYGSWFQSTYSTNPSVNLDANSTDARFLRLLALSSISAQAILMVAVLVAYPPETYGRMPLALVCLQYGIQFGICVEVIGGALLFFLEPDLSCREQDGMVLLASLSLTAWVFGLLMLCLMVLGIILGGP